MGLNSRQGGGGDLPSLDLAFALDKTLTARKGPTPAFTRVQATSTGSTYVGADKLIKYAAANEPRFDHDPATGASKGLLIEESRTNLLSRSEELGTSPWGVSGGIVITTNNAISPDGLQTADTIAFTASGNLAQTASMGSAGVVATFSIFVKAATSNGFARIIIADNTTVPTNFFGGWFNTLTGLWATTSTLGSGVVITSLVTNMNNGWYRISITGSMAGISNYSPFMYITDSDNSTIRSTSVSQHWWGAQLEAGSFPLSYIPTTSGSAIRSADVCSIVNTSPFWNQSEFTVFSQANFANPLHDAYALNFSPEYFGHRRPNNNSLMAIIRNSSANVDIQLGTFVTGAVKIASAHIAGQQSATVNGASVTSRSTAYVAESSSTLHIGSIGVGISQINGHIARITYYRKRLSNAKLQTLTTL